VNIKIFDGQEFIDAAGMALLVGETEEAVTAELHRQQATTPGRFTMPKRWIRQAKELQAKYGTSDLAEFVARRRAEEAGR
jgi:hypothetical protein